MARYLLLRVAAAAAAEVGEVLGMVGRVLVAQEQSRWEERFCSSHAKAEGRTRKLLGRYRGRLL